MRGVFTMESVIEQQQEPTSKYIIWRGTQGTVLCVDKI